MIQEATLVGTIVPDTVSLSGRVAADEIVLSAHANIADAFDQYNGPYDVTPKPYDDQSLSTKDKLMRDDVSVRRIPYESVSNQAGGNTVTIGGY